MRSEYKCVMSPIRVGKHIIKNRIIAAPVTLHSASNGENYPTDAAMNFFVERAKAGAGIVVCAGVKLLPVTDDGEHAAWDMYKHNAMNKLAELAEKIHFYGAKASMELIGIFEDGYVAAEGGLLMDGVTPGREIPIEEMERYKEGYAHSAEMLMNLGYDGILLHFGHSIPIAQFLSPLTNKRTDKYGGTFENRMRYIIEILQAIRTRVGNNMFIEIRMSANEFKDGGIDLEEGIKIAEALQGYADIIQASCGMVTPDLMCRTHPCDFLPPTPNVYLAEALKKSGKINAYITAIGGISSLAEADEIIGVGKADFVGIARAFIADPELIVKTLNGKEEDVVPCVKCMRCHDSTVFGHFMKCSVNPIVGISHSLSSMIVPIREKKKVAVIGGGPAGMYAAITAKQRGHLVTLYEKDDRLGGTLNIATKFKFKYSLKKFMNYLINQVEKSEVEVKLGTTVSAKDIECYDAVIVAIGAEPLIPPIKGIEHCTHAIKISEKINEIREKVIIIGGGEVGCEAALHLAGLGKQVVIVEMRGELSTDSSKTHRDELLSKVDLEPRIIQLKSAKCIEVMKDGITYEKDGEFKKESAQSIILAAGMKPRVIEADSFMGITDNYWVIGDCAKVRTVEMAVREGYFAGSNI